MPYKPKGSTVYWTSKPWRESTGTRDKQEAELYEQKLVISHAEGRAVRGRSKGQRNTDGVLLSVALDRWMDEEGKTSTYHVELSRSVLADVGDVLIHTITNQLLMDKIVRDTTNAPSTVNKKLRRVEVVLEQAHKVWDLKVDTKLDFRKLRRPKAKVKHTFYLSRELEAAILEHFTGNTDFQDFLVVAIETGCRSKELRQLEAGDINLSGQRIYVRDWHAGQSTKTGVIRAVPLTQRAARVLARRLQDYDKPFGMFTSKDAISRLWNEVADKFNLPREKGATFRCTRRTCGTRLAELGLSQAEIAGWLGHESMASTDHYVALSGQYMDKIRVLVDNHSKSGRVVKTLNENFELHGTITGRLDSKSLKDKRGIAQSGSAPALGAGCKPVQSKR